ncbi:MAG: hypothetical protein HC932_01210 [Thermales bacterium]|nr:hypothetical protein [Thermales bacterium]
METKGSNDINDLRPDEQIKIKCAIKHFEALGLKPLENKPNYVAPVKDREGFNQVIKKDEEYSQAELF